MNNKNEKGFALVLSIVLLLAMSLMAVALLLISAEDHRSNNAADEYQQTFYAAEMALIEGEQYVLNEKLGPYDANGDRQADQKNLPENLATVFTGAMTLKNYPTDVTDTNCFFSFKDIDRTTFKVVVAESWNLGNLLSDATVGVGGANEQARLDNFYYEYFITKIGDAIFQGAGSSVKLSASADGKNGMAYRIYGCGIFNGPDQQTIIPLESVIILPK